MYMCMLHIVYDLLTSTCTCMVYDLLTSTCMHCTCVYTCTCTDKIILIKCLPSSFHHFVQEVNEIWYLRSLTIALPEYQEWQVIEGNLLIKIILQVSLFEN